MINVCAFVCLYFVVVLWSRFIGFIWHIYPYSSWLFHWHRDDCPCVSEATLKDMGKIYSNRFQSMREPKPVAYFLRSSIYGDFTHDQSPAVNNMAIPWICRKIWGHNNIAVLFRKKSSVNILFTYCESIITSSVMWSFSNFALSMAL